jgi:DNA-binding CsgD family transcriptional regulator
MDLWQRLRRWLAPRPRSFHLDTGLAAPLLELARRQQRSPDEVAADLLAEALQQRQVDAENTRLWRSLTRREQEVTALICLNYTSDEIALRLSLSPETVKTHARRILAKSGLSSRARLRQRLRHWDFSAWDVLEE